MIIDFSSPQNLKERLEFAKRKHIGIVLASTGFTAEDIKLIDEYSASVAIFKTANLSLGVNLMQALCKAAAAVLGDAGMGPALPRLAVISAVSLYAAACSLSLVLSAGRDGESR